MHGGGLLDFFRRGSGSSVPSSFFGLPGASGASLRDMMTGESMLMVMIMVIVIAIVMIILYIVYLIKTGSNQTSVIGDGTVVNVSSKKPTITEVSMTNNTPAQYGAAVWLYFGAGSTGSTGIVKLATFGDAIGLFIDNTANQLVAKVATMPDGTDNAVVLAMNYVPRQRWVNVAVSVRDTVATLYVDGEIYSVMTIHDATRTATAFKEMFDAAGKTKATLGNADQSVEAYLANARVYNYAPIQPDVAAQYSSGPYVQSWLSWLGLGRYKLRNPIYEVGSESASCTAAASART